ncbi:dihydrofolate reductase family protein [Pararhizobium haloflavum]|uniref:dihydrofolate reductase family protein n=1 Tax=Pararhizobium haloflavum TaxID=2037914 RepID=UPI000C1915DC|nr:dihydrofolate reductase family protein [Pararhizobium haloflavum]
MAKLIVWNLVTVDGYFEGAEKWVLPFHELAWGEELEALSLEFGRTAGLLVFGRVTYEGMKAHWTQAEDGDITRFMNALPKLVASRSLRSSDWNNTRVTAEIIPELSRLKREMDQPIYVFGSAELTDGLLAAGLVDELMLCIVPVLLGHGTPFFKPADRPIALRCVETRPLSNGSVIVRYEPQA